MGCSSPCGRRCNGATPAAKRRYDRVPHDARRPVGRLIYVTPSIPRVFAMPVLPQLCWGWTNLGHNLCALWVVKTVRPGSSPETEVVRYLRQEPQTPMPPILKASHLSLRGLMGLLSPRGLKPPVAQRECCPILLSGFLPLCRENARRFSNRSRALSALSYTPSLRRVGRLHAYVRSRRFVVAFSVHTWIHS